MSNNIKIKWKFKRPKSKSIPAVPAHFTMSDARLELLANRYQSNHICYLLDITFEAYLLNPQGWSRIAKHLKDGGGCRMLEGMLVINAKKEGICAWCARWWSERSGGLNSNDLCPECARNMHSPLPESSVCMHATHRRAVKHG